MTASQPCDLLVATTNKKKLKELQTLLANLSIRLHDLSEFPAIQEIRESGKTFEDNAILKATGYAKQTHLLTLAEDSGLCCDALEGAPGVYSARFAGPEQSDEKNNQKLLKLLETVPDNCRRAYFKSAVAIAEPESLIGVVEGEVHGYISREMLGEKGFGYDPVFYYLPFQKTFGQVSAEMKHKVSHRSKALEKAKQLLADYLAKKAGAA
jgi:XTP/dITP diphosphohydrolase